MKKKKLLAIVDDWERLERYEDRLHRLFDFHSSPFGGHGVEMAIEHQPDLILIDLEFEDMDENEALSLIRAQEDLHQAQIVLITNSLDDEQVHGSQVRSFPRPVSLESLQIFLESIIAKTE